MISLMAVFIILLILPFVLGYLHLSYDKKTPKLLVYYRYFIIFNMVFAGSMVALRMLFDGQHAAEASGWSFSPIYYLYGAAILSMALTGLIVLNTRTKVMLVPAVLWGVFLILSTLSYYYDVAHAMVMALDMIYLHILYNLVVASIMGFFLFLFKDHYKKQLA